MTHATSFILNNPNNIKLIHKLHNFNIYLNYKYYFRPQLLKSNHVSRPTNSFPVIIATTPLSQPDPYTLNSFHHQKLCPYILAYNPFTAHSTKTELGLVYQLFLHQSPTRPNIPSSWYSSPTFLPTLKMVKNNNKKITSIRKSQSKTK